MAFRKSALFRISFIPTGGGFINTAPGKTGKGKSVKMIEFWDSENIDLQAIKIPGNFIDHRNEDGNTGTTTEQAVPLDKYFCHQNHWSNDEDADLYDPYDDPASDQYSAW